MLKSIASNIKRLFSEKQTKTPTVLTDQEQHNLRAYKSVQSHVERIKNGEKKVPDVAKRLQPGELTQNSNWMYIQSVGDYISPVGNDKLHTVKIFEVKDETRTMLAKIECTNSIYSEWLVACSNSMWHTKFIVAHDIHGNQFPLGKMISTVCEIKY